MRPPAIKDDVLAKLPIISGANQCVVGERVCRNGIYCVKINKKIKGDAKIWYYLQIGGEKIREIDLFLY